MRDDDLITKHAVSRYRQRIEDAPYSVIRHRLLTPAVRDALEALRHTSGAVRIKAADLTVVIKHGRIVTVLPGGDKALRHAFNFRRTNVNAMRGGARRPGAWKQQLVREGVI